MDTTPGTPSTHHHAPNRKQIAIIGSGIAGLTLARCLGNEEYDIHIFEKRDAFGEIGAAISVFPNALCVMDELGLLDELLAGSGIIQKIHLKTSSGSILSSSEPAYEYPAICAHRAYLHSVLLKNITASLHPGHGLRSLVHEADGRVSLTFDNGQVRSFDAVIGADGIRSMVREHIIGDGEPIFRGYNIWRGVVRSDFAIGHGSETFGKGQRVGIVPIKDGLYGWWATCNEAYLQDDEPEGTRKKLQRLFGSWHHPIPELIANTEEILKNSLVDRKPLRGWTKGMSTLIGDAAHPTTPNLGQGGCIAIEGAYILARCIQKFGLGQAAFACYEALHFPRAKMVNEESLQLGRMGQWSNPLLVGFRNAAFKAMPSKLAMKMVDKFFAYRVTKLLV